MLVQVFTYVSQKMLSEGSEKSWDQCRVKLKNLKSQWRYVRDRVPGIEEADMEDEDVVRQVMTDCQNRGVSPTCIKHLRCAAGSGAIFGSAGLEALPN
jgi:hypothetical protein